MTEEKPQRGWTGFWIPRAVVEAKDITWFQKILLAEIESLDAGNNYKGCWASNEYLANVFGTTKDNMSQQVSDLRKKDYLYDLGFNGRTMLRKCRHTSSPKRSESGLDPLVRTQGSSESGLDAGTSQESGLARVRTRPIYNRDTTDILVENKEAQDFEKFWACWPVGAKVGKPAALKSWNGLKPAEREKCLGAVTGYAKAVADTPTKFIPNPSTWLNQRRFADDPSTWSRSGKPVDTTHYRPANTIEIGRLA